MRDKENRRNLVYFLHNRLPHFKVFNGISIKTLFSKVSCGRDYLDDILTHGSKSPTFFVPSHHIITIGEKKNLLGQPAAAQPSLSSPVCAVPLSPFCLDEAQSPTRPSHDTTTPNPASQETPAVPHTFHRSLLHNNSVSATEPPPHDRRGRSTSMFETNTAESEKEEGSRRHRGYSVHDIILQINKEDASPRGEEKLPVCPAGAGSEDRLPVYPVRVEMGRDG